MKQSLFQWAAIAMMFVVASCSDNNGVEEAQEGLLGDAETYVTINVAMPSGGSSTRADDGESEYEQGTTAENTFNSVTLYFFATEDASTTCKGIMTFQGSAFTEGTTETNNVDVVYKKTNAQRVGITGTFQVYAVLNGVVSGASEGMTLSSFLTSTVSASTVIGGASNGTAANLTYLLMTSRTPGSVEITTSSTQTNPASLTVSVERTAARIDFTASTTGNGYTIANDKVTNESSVSVTISGYKLVNLRNDAYYFRRVGSADGTITIDTESNGGGDQSATAEARAYVVDNYFGAKNRYDMTSESYTDDAFNTAWFGDGKAYQTNPETTAYITLPTSTTATALAYCMENTMPQTKQLNGYTTGIIFKAVYVPNKVWTATSAGVLTQVDYTAGDSFYRYGDMLFETTTDITNYAGSTITASDYQTYTGDGTIGATCYYKYWIKHNASSTNMDIMEFAIVRNNVYKLSINSVTGLGDPDDTITPTEEDEKEEMYMDVLVNILKWVVRTNTIDL